jgi:hypothetical protein
MEGAKRTDAGSEASIEAIRHWLRWLSTEIRTLRAEQRADIVELRAELRAATAELRAELRNTHR